MSRPRRLTPFGVLIALGICNHLVLTGSRVAVSLDALSLGANAATVGTLLALFALLPMLFAIPAGRLADRVGVRGPMLAGSIGIAGAAIIATAIAGLPALFVTVTFTVYCACAELNECCTLWPVTCPEPSPKSQAYVCVPQETS